jgi:hypothetical protein
MYKHDKYSMHVQCLSNTKTFCLMVLASSTYTKIGLHVWIWRTLVGFLHVLIPIGISKILMLQVRIVLVNQVIISNQNYMYKDLAIDPNTCVSVCTMFFIMQNFHVGGGS